MTDLATVPSLHRDGHRATIHFNRPKVHNRIEPADIVELMRLLDQVDADRDIRVLVFTASGKSFSSGFHIGEIGGGDGEGAPGFEGIAAGRRLGQGPFEGQAGHFEIGHINAPYN